MQQQQKKAARTSPRGLQLPALASSSCGYPRSYHREVTMRIPKKSKASKAANRERRSKPARDSQPPNRFRRVLDISSSTWLGRRCTRDANGVYTDSNSKRQL